MRSGFAIAIAWPETLCKQPGSWYDKPMQWIGVNKDNYYKVGHAAVVLISASGECHYFDFGRYHAPFQHGRVRDAETDHDLEMKTRAVIKENEIINYTDILTELYFNSSCHGNGTLHASHCKINFEKAYKKAKLMQKKSPIPYGPFKIDGTNCSRFVNTVILAGKPGFLGWLLLKYPKTLSPTPIGNVMALNNYQRIQWQGDSSFSLPEYSFLKQNH